MPIYPRGYRRWTGELGGAPARLLAIARAGCEVAWRSRWLRRFLPVAWVPLVWIGVFFWLAGQVTEPEVPWYARGIAQAIGEQSLHALRTDPAARPALWSVLFSMFFQFSQFFLVMIVVALVGPGLIAADRRHNAHEIYFARPVGWAEYIGGKWAVVAAYVGAITVLPALVLYVIGVLASPSVAAVVQTAYLIPRLVAVWLVWSLAVGLPILALSSLGTSSRLVAFLWIVLWMGSELVADAVRGVAAGAAAGGATGWAGLLSLPQDLAAAAFGILGVRASIESFPLSPVAKRTLRDLAPDYDPVLALAVLGGLALVSLAVLRARVRPEGAA